MGCGGAALKVTNETKIMSGVISTQVNDFDQIFSLVSAKMEVAEKIRAQVNTSYQLCIRITKVNKLKGYNISEAFKLWFWAVAACNKGTVANLKADFSQEKQEWNLDKCSDIKLQFFPVCLKNFILGLQKEQEFAKIRGEIGYLFEKCKALKEGAMDLFKGLDNMEKAKKGALLTANFAKLGYGAAAATQFEGNFPGFKKELNDLLTNLESLKKDASTKGQKAANDYGVLEFPKGSGTFRLGFKMDMLHILHGGQKRSVEDQKEELEEKAERAKDKPMKSEAQSQTKIVNGKKIDQFLDLHTDEKTFPYRLRTPGIKYFNTEFSIIGFSLQQFSESGTKVKANLDKLDKIVGGDKWKDSEKKLHNYLKYWLVYSKAFYGLETFNTFKVEISNDTPYFKFDPMAVGKVALFKKFEGFADFTDPFITTVQNMNSNRLALYDGKLEEIKQKYQHLRTFVFSEESLIIHQEANSGVAYSNLSATQKNIQALEVYIERLNVLYPNIMNPLKALAKEYDQNLGSILSESDEDSKKVDAKKEKFQEYGKNLYPALYK